MLIICSCMLVPEEATAVLQMPCGGTLDSWAFNKMHRTPPLARSLATPLRLC